MLSVGEEGLRMVFERDFEHALGGNNRYNISVNLHLRLLVLQFILVNHCVVHLAHRHIH
jgi:hypothetical protein